MKVVRRRSSSPASKTITIRQRYRSNHWYGVLCMCAIGLVLAHVAWAEVPNETYDFSISKGVVEFGRGHYDKAADLFEQARQAVPNDPEAIEYLGQALLHLKKYRDAETLFQDLTLSHPTRIQPWLGLAIAQTQLGKYHEALASLDQAQKEFEAAIAAGEPESELARSARAILQQRTAAPKGPKPWDLNLNVSGQYDTNVVLLPIGIQPPGGSSGISQKDDFRTTFYARGEYRPIQTPLWVAGGTYGFYQSFHQNLTAFDIQDHAPSVFVQHQLGIVTARLQYAFDYVRVGEDPFLFTHAVQPIFTIAESNSLFSQIQFRYQNKDFQDDRFAGNSFRDGKNWLAGLTQYAYFANGTGHIRLGYTFDTDRTGGGHPLVATPGVQTHADWDSKAHRLSVGLGIPDIWTLKPSFAFDYYHMDYDNPNSFSAGGITKRRDNVMFFTATIGRPITDWLSIAAEYNYTKDQSNLPVFNYARSIFSLPLSSRF